jgi:hypothetical protein
MVDCLVLELTTENSVLQLSGAMIWEKNKTFLMEMVSIDCDGARRMAQ